MVPEPSLNLNIFSICQCGATLFKDKMKVHMKTKTHISRIAAIERKQKMVTRYVKCECGAYISHLALSKHKISTKHKINLKRKVAVDDVKAVRCDCGAFYLNCERAKHLRSRIHKKNILNQEKEKK